MQWIEVCGISVGHRASFLSDSSDGSVLSGSTNDNARSAGVLGERQNLQRADIAPLGLQEVRLNAAELVGIQGRKEDAIMPEKETVEAAKRDLQEGKSPSTAAGEFVREEIEHVREGKHGVRSPKQAIAIGLSKARRAGIPLGAPDPKTTSAATRKKAAQDSRRGEESPVTSEEGSTKRGKARLKAMKREPKSSVSRAALSRQAKSTARKRGQTIHRKSK
jgi:hypothetical protein